MMLFDRYEHGNGNLTIFLRSLALFLILYFFASFWFSLSI